MPDLAKSESYVRHYVTLGGKAVNEADPEHNSASQAYITHSNQGNLV